MESGNKKFFSTAFTLTGTIVGAGILGLPYVFSRAGFYSGLFWLVFLGVVMILVNLYLGEVTLRTKDIHQLPGYASKYLGTWGKWVMVVSAVFGIYSALIAYLIGEGQSFSKLFTGGTDYSILFGVGFWLFMTIFLRGGLSRLKKIGFYGVIAVISLVSILFFVLLPDVSVENLQSVFPGDNFFLPFGVVLFSLLGFTSIPELRREVGADRHLLKKSILLGSLVPIALYVMFSLAFVGVLGENVAEVATLSFTGFLGKVLLVLGIFTMMTAFFVLSFALGDYFVYDLRERKFLFYGVSLVPLVLYLVISFFNFAGFIKILGVAGAVSGGIAGILILMMNLAAKKKGDRKPEYSIPTNWIVVGVLSLVFLAGIFLEVF